MEPKKQTLDKLLTPSWLSGLIAVTAGLVVAVGVILTFSLNNSQVQQQLVAWQNTSAPSLTLPGQNPPGSNNNSLQNTWPLLGFWLIVGLAAYYVVEGIARGFRETAELKKELDYVHARRNELLRESIVSVLIRLLSAIAWLIFIEAFFKRITPYSITAAHASASDPKSLSGVLYALLSFAMVALSLHLHAVFLRLCAGRSRLFSAA